MRLNPPMPAVISIQPALPVELCSTSVEVCLWGGGVCVSLPLHTLGRIPPPISQPDPGRGVDLQTETHWASSARPRPPWGGSCLYNLTRSALRRVLCPLPVQGETWLALFLQPFRRDPVMGELTLWSSGALKLT
jgi:hypothetical protein